MSRLSKFSRVKHHKGKSARFRVGDVVDVADATDIRSIYRVARFLPHLLSAPPSVHIAMHFRLAGSDVDLPCSVEMTR
jgi:hypothetical protein